MRARLLGLVGVAVAAGATGWAFAGGADAPVVTLVFIGVVLALADAAVWRAAGDGSDPDIPAGQRLPRHAWGARVAVTAAIGAAFDLLGLDLFLAPLHGHPGLGADLRGVHARS